MVLSALTTQAFSFDLKTAARQLLTGHPVVQLGGFLSHQGKAQFGGIQGLIGDNYTIRSHNGQNGLLGLGYYWDGPERRQFNLSYGVDAFYLPKTFVKGYVVQELMFTNLAYDYSITHAPVFAAAKATFNRPSTNYAFTVDAGIGPNFMSAGNFHERTVKGSTALPDNPFSGHSSVAFAAMVGAGVQLQNIFNQKTPLECGYRFMYLGTGELSTNSSQYLNTLHTGPAYANALLCSVTF